MTDPFVLDRTENPHPRMREHALMLRRSARVSGDSIVGATWLGYLDAMCDATGESAADINAWLDRYDDLTLAEKIVRDVSVQVKGPSRRR